MLSTQSSCQSTMQLGLGLLVRMQVHQLGLLFTCHGCGALEEEIMSFIVPIVDDQKV